MITPVIFVLFIAAVSGQAENSTAVCNPDFQYLCEDDSNNCIDKSSVCDGLYNCWYGSDERDCTSCQPGAFFCESTKKCIAEYWRCNGYADCSNGYSNDTSIGNDDEIGCDTCSDGAFLCMSDKMCVNAHLSRCNGFKDCADGSDEEDCESYTCSTNYEFQCSNRQCIYQWDVCNGYANCADGSDELDCSAVTTSAPYNNTYNYGYYGDYGYNYNATNDSLSTSNYWNNYNSGCTDFQCSNDTFKCQCSYYDCYANCLPVDFVCDGYQNCNYGDDEQNCTNCNNEEYTFHCPSTNKCIPKYNKCNGYNDCGGYGVGDDEVDCPCEPWQHKCANGQCTYSTEPMCDGYNQCYDGSDEANCTSCVGDAFKCNSGNVTCVPRWNRCDGYQSCEDGSDEQHCDQNVCNQNEFKCANGQCISMWNRCDGYQTCNDNSDEIDCASFTTQSWMWNSENSTEPNNGTSEVFMTTPLPL